MVKNIGRYWLEEIIKHGKGRSNKLVMQGLLLARLFRTKPVKPAP